MNVEEARERFRAHHTSRYRKTRRRERKKRRKYVVRAVRKAERVIRRDSQDCRVTTVRIKYPAKVGPVARVVQYILIGRGFDVVVVDSTSTRVEPLPMGVPVLWYTCTLDIGW